MLVLVKKIDRITDFDDEEKMSVCEIILELELVNCEDLEEKARLIDKEYYSKNCFGIDYNYVYSEDKLYILNVPNAIYYVDNNGDKNYFEVDKTIIKNIEEVLLVEIEKFKKDKKKYVEQNNVGYSII